MIVSFFKLLYSLIEGRTGYRKHGHNSIVKHPYRIWNKDVIEIGKNVFIAENSFFAISKKFKDQKFKPTLKIGDDVQIGSNLFISCIDSIIIQNDVTISDRVFISDHSHDYSNTKVPIKNQSLKKEGGVLIKKGAFIGVNAVIMPGVVVGENSVVGASSVVTKSIPDYSVAAGIPAKIIKRFNERSNKWEKN